MRLGVWCLVSLLVGATLAYAVLPGGPVPYPEVVVPAARIIEREVPGEVRWRDRIVYRYLTPELRATAPQGATGDVQTFCAPVVAVVQGDTTRQPRREVVRSVVAGSSLFPLRKDPLLVTSMDGYGDLYSRDYHVRPGFSIGSGDSVLVRYPRWAPLKEIGEGALWFAGFRLLEEIVR